MAYKKVYVDLEDFDDDELLDELKSRGKQLPIEEDLEPLTQAWIAGRNGDKDKAYALMWEYTLNKLGKVV
jgi:hypothetical protein